MATQNHIHLSTALGSAPENSPTYKWGVTMRDDIPNVVLSIRTTLRGGTRIHVLKNDSDEVIQKIDYSYSVVVRDEEGMTASERRLLLIAMQGKKVYLVDNLDHPDDGTDHTDSVRPMVLAEIGSFRPRSPALNEFDVDIMLVDYSQEV